MREKNKTVYYCNFCKKHTLTKHSMVNHENRCNNNPINDRKCFHCQNLDMEDYMICNDNGYDTGRTIKIFFCKDHSDYLHPPITEHKCNFLGDTMPMVKKNEECKEFKPTASFMFGQL